MDQPAQERAFEAAPDRPTGPSPVQARFAGVTHLKISTPLNPSYNGTVFGVKFNDGAALVSRAMKNRWGYSLEQLAEKFSLDLDTVPGGYQVEGQWLDSRPTDQLLETVDETPVLANTAEKSDARSSKPAKTSKPTRKLLED